MVSTAPPPEPLRRPSTALLASAGLGLLAASPVLVQGFPRPLSALAFEALRWALLGGLLWALARLRSRPREASLLLGFSLAWQLIGIVQRALPWGAARAWELGCARLLAQPELLGLGLFPALALRLRGRAPRTLALALGVGLLHACALAAQTSGPLSWTWLWGAAGWPALVGVFLARAVGAAPGAPPGGLERAVAALPLAVLAGCVAAGLPPFPATLGSAALAWAVRS